MSKATVKLQVEVRPSAPHSTSEPMTLVEMFERVTRSHPKPNTLNFKKDGQWQPISSDEMLTRIRQIAAGFYSLGVRHGDRVALLSESRVEWTLTDAACQFAGAIDVPIYPTLAPQQVRYIIEDSGARVLVVNSYEKFVQLQEILKNCRAIEQIVFFDEAGVDKADGLTLRELEERGRALVEKQPSLVDDLAHETHPGDLATIIYTSGTTGEPKGVMLTHANLVSNLVDSAGQFTFGQADSALSVLPLSHVFERTAMYMYLHHGMAIYFGESLDKIGPNLREVRPTIFVGVPRIFEKIYARVKETSAAKGKLNLALLNWAVSVGKEQARFIINHQKVPFWLALKHRLASRLVL
ncbi:MAG TPA: AMP-binding protein, partial [Pyrinomonadaceae bacterium]|nr:AMP-binding protein [Pyrinomonadaceae bacterium]